MATNGDQVTTGRGAGCFGSENLGYGRYIGVVVLGPKLYQLR